MEQKPKSNPVKEAPKGPPPLPRNPKDLQRPAVQK